jgi:hypothetical protein
MRKTKETNAETFTRLEHHQSALTPASQRARACPNIARSNKVKDAAQLCKTQS